MDEPRALGAGDLKPGSTAAFERDVGERDIQSFAALSGDHNPLHVDPNYARSTNYGRQVAHGAFQVALASATAGWHLPGRSVVVGSYHSRFPAPWFIPSRVRAQGEIASWMPLSNTGTLRTGAGGGAGVELLEAPASDYRIIALRRSQVPAAFSALPGVCALNCDLEASDWETTLDTAISAEPVYGIVHGAWPSAPKGRLLDTDPAIVARQVEFGSLVKLRLAPWLSRTARDQARFVAVSTTSASVKPLVGLSACSPGKATLEHSVRLPAPELSRKGITMNAVLPSFMPTGMNGTATKKAVLGETARVPAGRLCTPQDVAAAVKYLLSRESSFVTGQMFPLTGRQL